MSADANPADSSPAPAPLAALSSADLKQWRVTGEKPSAADPSAEPSASPAASSEEQTASTDATPSAASEPAKGRGVTKRNAELDAEIEALQQKLKTRAELRAQLDQAQPAPSDAKPAASSPASEFPSFDDWMQSHPHDTYETYVRAAARFEAKQEFDARETARREADAAKQRDDSARSRLDSFTKRAQEAATADPTIRERIGRMGSLVPVDALPPGQTIGPENVIAQECVVSPYGVQMAVYLNEHPEEFARLVSLEPVDLVRAMGRLEARFEDAPARPALKTVTDAPPPPPSIRPRATVPSDEIEAALAAGDFRRYKQLANARDIANAARR